jgi:site-specific DNA-methyltransferase (adenine-specific)
MAFKKHPGGYGSNTICESIEQHRVNVNKRSHSQCLLVGDCLTRLNEIELNSIDVIVTSPPYNIGLNYSKYIDKKSPDEYLKWLVNIFVETNKYLKTDGSIFLNIAGTNVNPWIPMQIATELKKTYVLQNSIIWVKSIAIKGNTHGHFKPIKSERYLNNNYEYIFHFTKTGNVGVDRLSIGVPYKYKSNIKRFNHDLDLRCAGNVWFVPYTTTQSKADKFNHPGTYPVELVERCLKLHGLGPLSVLDPFVGTGTTLKACMNLNHYGIGIDIDPDYIKLAKLRLSNE